MKLHEGQIWFMQLFAELESLVSFVLFDSSLDVSKDATEVAITSS